MTDIETNKANPKKKKTKPSLADEAPLNTDKESEKQTTQSTSSANPGEHIEDKSLIDKFSKKEKIKLIIEILVALGTIGNAIIFWVVSSTQRTDTLKSITLADSSLSMTKQSIEIVQENFSIENSALLASSQPVFYFQNGYEKYTISATVTNFGKTVADSVFYWSDYIVSEKNTSYNPSVRKEFSNVPFFVLPDNSFTISDTIKRRYIDPSGFRLVNEKARFFFYGEVRYKTIGGFDTLSFMSVNTSTSESGDFVSYGTFNKLK